MPLPAPPAVRVLVARDRTAQSSASGGFLDVHRFDLVARLPDGSDSPPFAYDVVDRRAIDAVVIAAHFVEEGAHRVYLRSAVRPPCALRASPPGHGGTLWELPAGLVEPGEDPAAAAARELLEELGFALEASAMRALGEWTFPAPGIIAERHLFYRVEVDPRVRAPPEGDGSVLERVAAIVAVPIAEALDHCRGGTIRDAKTELGLRRLAEVLS